MKEAERLQQRGRYNERSACYQHQRMNIELNELLIVVIKY